MNIDKHSFDKKKVLIFGFGTNGGGQGTLDFLLTTKVSQIIITDQKTEEDFVAARVALSTDSRIMWRLGEHKEEDFKLVDVVIKNPGIKWDHPLLLIAKAAGADIIMDSTIFVAICPAPIIGITGSKGKTTTASLVAHILESAGKKVVRAGISQTGVLSELSKITPKSVVVFELSSWRLSGLTPLQKSPHISILTNLYPDHLNYYGNMKEYAKDKKIITQYQTDKDFFILPGNSANINNDTDFFSETKATIKTFGGNTPYAWQEKEKLWLWNREKNEEPVLLLQKQDALLTGEHFFDNMLAAALAAKSFGLSLGDIQNGLKSFTGVPHRFQLVRELDGIRYINDTAATIPSATLASVKAATSPVVLLAGGSDKNLPLTELLTAIGRSKYTFLFAGTGTDKIIRALSEESKRRVDVVKSMTEAISQAKKCAESGDTILLAPGAASFGMFKNEFDRGDQFIQEVQKL